MNRLSKILIVPLLLITSAIKAQFTTYVLPHIGFEYQNQGFGDLGLRFLFLKNDNVLYRVSGSALMGEMHHQFAVMPKVQADVLFNFEKNVDIFHSWYFLLGAETTNKFFAPKAGFSLFGILDVTGGYGFSYGDSLLKDKRLNGFNFNFSLNLPTVIFSKKK